MKTDDCLKALKEGQTLERKDIGDKEHAEHLLRLLQAHVIDMKKVIKQLKSY